MALKTDYKDDVLNATMNGKRRYRKTEYSDGTFSLEDVTTYDQVGDDFAAKDVNEANKEVNLKFDSDDVVDPMLATEGGFAADALKTKEAVNELNSKIDNTWQSNVDIYEVIRTNVKKFGAGDTFMLSFGNGLTNAPEGFTFFTLIYKNQIMFAYSNKGIAVTRYRSGTDVFDAWSYP